MICYRCNHDAGNNDVCPLCGSNLSVFHKTLRLSNMYYNDGLKKAEVRNLSGAIISLKKSLKFNKYNIDARNLLGLVYYEMGEVVDALSEWVISKSYRQDENVAGRYLDAIRQNRSQLDAINQTIKKYNQALLYCKQDSRDLAIIQLKKVLSLNPHLVKAHQLLALLYLQEDKLELAKKTLREAGKIDANNTTTLRYLKEANIRLKEKGKNKKKKEEDILSYQSGNETIIMPLRFKESSLGSSLGYLLIGLLVGAAAIGFLVVPGVQRQAQQEANEKMVEANDTLTANAQTITFLEAEVEELEQKLAEIQGQGESAPAQTAAYESLLDAYVAYNDNDYLSAGLYLDEVDTSQLSDNAKNVYNTIWAAVEESYFEQLYNVAYDNYANEKDYEEAIEYFLKVVNHNKDYKDGYAIYYLAQAYNKNNDMDSARQYYQYVVDNYPDSERATTAKKYLNAE